MPTANMSLDVYFMFISLCTLFEMTNSRSSTMWKLNSETGKIEKHDFFDIKINDDVLIDENILYNWNAMVDIYSSDKPFFTVVTSKHIKHNGWLRQSTEISLESLLKARNLLKTDATLSANNKKSRPLSTNVNIADESALRNKSENFNSLDCGQPLNYTNYDYIVNLGSQYEHKEIPIMPEPDVIYFFLNSHDQEEHKNFNVEDLEKRLIYFKKKNPLTAEIYHQIGNYWRIIGEPVQAIKCFRRSLDISPSASEVMYDLAKVLYNLQYLDDAINMARRSIEFQIPPYSAWRQYLLLGDIMKSYGDLKGSVYYYRLALELNPTQENILRSLNDAVQKPVSALHAYTIVIIVILVIMVLTVILTSTIIESGDHTNTTNGQCVSNSEIYDIKPQRHFNRAMAMRSLKGLSTSRSGRQRKY